MGQTVSTFSRVIGAEHPPVDDAEGGVAVGRRAEGRHERGADAFLLVDLGPQDDLEVDVGFAGW